jgi:flagellar basal-body rod protein FlgF
LDTTTTIALSRLIAQQRAMDVTAGNIANANTPAYRAERVQFSDWLMREPTLGRRPGEQVLAYAQDRATWREQQPGSVSHTGNPFDLALGNPDAWFTVQTQNGPRLTRAGHFMLDSKGQIVDPDGNALLDRNGQPLVLASADTHVTVAGDGTVSSENGQVGTIGVVSPSSFGQMLAEGGRLYVAPAADTTQPVASPGIVQGAIEESNVQPINELNQMTGDLREFQFVTQLVQAESDRQQGAIDKILNKRS